MLFVVRKKSTGVAPRAATGTVVLSDPAPVTSQNSRGFISSCIKHNLCGRKEFGCFINVAVEQFVVQTVAYATRHGCNLMEQAPVEFDDFVMDV